MGKLEQKSFIAGKISNDNRSASNNMLTRSMLTIDIDNADLTISSSIKFN